MSPPTWRPCSPIDLTDLQALDDEEEAAILQTRAWLLSLTGRLDDDLADIQLQPFVPEDPPIETTEVHVPIELIPVDDHQEEMEVDCCCEEVVETTTCAVDAATADTATAAEAAAAATTRNALTGIMNDHDYDLWTADQLVGWFFDANIVGHNASREDTALSAASSPGSGFATPDSESFQYPTPRLFEEFVSVGESSPPDVSFDQHSSPYAITIHIPDSSEAGHREHAHSILETHSATSIPLFASPRDTSVTAESAEALVEEQEAPVTRRPRNKARQLEHVRRTRANQKARDVLDQIEIRERETSIARLQRHIEDLDPNHVRQIFVGEPIPPELQVRTNEPRSKRPPADSRQEAVDRERENGRESQRRKYARTKIERRNRKNQLSFLMVYQEQLEARLQQLRS